MSPKAAEVTYKETMADLKARIEAKFGSVRKFCVKQNPKIDHANLYRAFSVDNPKEMSVGLYIRVCVGLGIHAGKVYPEQLLLNLSLKDYFLIDNNAIFTSLITLRFDYDEEVQDRGVSTGSQKEE